MDFDFGKLKKQVTKTALKAKEASGNMVETAKFRLKLSELKADIDDKYIQIGKMVYNSDEDSDVTDKVQSLCDEITKLKEEAEKVQNLIDELLNKKTCQSCSASIDKNFNFCPKCGADLNE